MVEVVLLEGDALVEPVGLDVGDDLGGLGLGDVEGLAPLGIVELTERNDRVPVETVRAGGGKIDGSRQGAGDARYLYKLALRCLLRHLSDVWHRRSFWLVSGREPTVVSSLPLLSRGPCQEGFRSCCVARHSKMSGPPFGAAQVFYRLP